MATPLDQRYELFISMPCYEYTYNVNCERVSASLCTSVIVVGLCQSSIKKI